MVCLVVHISLVSYSVVHLSYGVRDWDFPPENYIPLAKLVAAGHPFMLIAIIWSKTAFGVTLLRITDGWMKRTVWFLIITTNIFLGFSILIFYVQCRPVQATWDPRVKGVCWDRDAVIKYHIFSGAYSAAADFALALLPWRLVWHLQMRTKEKVGVGIAMSMGIFAGVASIIKTYELRNLYSGTLYDTISLMYWGPIETAAIMVASSIPVLRVLVRQVRSSAKQYYLADERTDCEGTGPKRKVAVLSRNQSRDDDRSDKSILDQATGGVLVTHEVSISSPDPKDQDSLGGYEMDVLQDCHIPANGHA
ncbi:hypothetical protein ACJZ2D_012011 [Fusarium nematophilum]